MAGDLATLAVGTGLSQQPAAASVSTEITNLIGLLCNGSTPCSTAGRAQNVAIAACAAALGNADVLID